MKNRLKIITFIFGFLIISSFLTNIYFNHTNNTITDLNISNESIKTFNIKQVDSRGNQIVFSGKYKKKEIKIEMFKNMIPLQAKNYISDKVFMVNTLFREVHSSYPGALSNIVGCSDEFKPKTIPNHPFDYYIIYATERLTYGACSWDLIKYKTVLYFIYCDKKNELYQIEFFVPLYENTSSYEDLLKSINCF